MNFRVDMVRTAGKYNTASSCLFQILNGLFALFLNIFTRLCQFFPGSMGCCFDLFCRNIFKHFDKTVCKDCFRRKCHERIHKFNARIFQFVHIVLDILRIRRDDRTVVMIDCIRELITLIWYTGIENKFHTFFDQPAHMTVCQFCRITFGFTWNRLNTQLINLTGRSRRKYNLVFQFCKECIPERIVFEHVQDTRNTYLASGCLIRTERFVGKQSFVFIFIKIRNVIFVLFFTDASFAAVSADKLTSAGEFVDRQTAVVGTSAAVRHRCCIFQFIDLVNGKHCGLFAIFITLSCNQCRTKSSHNTCNIRTDGFTVGNTFKASKNSVIVEGTTLYNDMSAKFSRIGNFDNFVKSVFDNRVSQTRRDIRYFCTFLLCLFYF